MLNLHGRCFFDAFFLLTLCFSTYLDFQKLQVKVNQINFGGLYRIKTSPLIFCVNQWTGFSMIGTSVMKGLNKFDLF